MESGHSEFKVQEFTSCVFLGGVGAQYVAVCNLPFFLSYYAQVATFYDILELIFHTIEIWH